MLALGDQLTGVVEWRRNGSGEFVSRGNTEYGRSWCRGTWKWLMRECSRRLWRELSSERVIEVRIWEEFWLSGLSGCEERWRLIR